MTYTRKETIGRATLYLGDCRDVFASLPECFRPQAIVTDPPYGQKYRAPAPRTSKASDRGLNGGWVRTGSRPTPDRVVGDDKPADVQWLVGAADEVLIWGAHRFNDQLPQGQWLVWDKRVDLPAIDQGDAEAAWLNRKGPMRVIRHKWSGLIIEPNTEEAERVPGTSSAQARLHPTQKPLRVMRWCLGFIKATSICDPYMGSGSTGVAAVGMGKHFLGCEIVPEYFDIACKRIEDAQRQSDLFIGAAA